MKQRQIVLLNIAEAREQLEEIEKALLNQSYEEVELQIHLEHAYHHLNYAWNIRGESDEALAAHTAADFARWSKYPFREIQEYE